MAELLQRAFSLNVVKARLGDLDGVPQVNIELVENRDGEQHILESKRFPLGWFGFADGMKPEASSLHVHYDVTRWIGGWAQRELSHDEVLWLHLVKPYGPLGAVPWEQELQPAVGVPLLRLPDALPDPERSESIFTMALGVAVAPRKGGLVGLAAMIARAVSTGVGDRLRLHIFVNLEDYGHAAQLLADVPHGRAILHDPHEGDRATPSEPGTLQNGWLRWMRSATAGQTLDAVHIVAHGRLVGDEGAILTAGCPASDDDQFRVELSQAEELRAFLTEVGALTVGFSHPGEGGSDRALWQLTDELGATRAGPVLLHDAREADATMDQLAAAWAFLAAPPPAMPPAHPSLVLFAQPRQVAGVDLGDAPGPMSWPALDPSAAVTEHFSREETPRWLAASQRFIEETTAGLMRLEEAGRERTLTSAEKDRVAGVEAALRQIRDLVDRHAERVL